MERSLGYPGYDSLMPKSARHDRRNFARQRLQHRLVRQEPQCAGLAEQRAGPFDLWPTGLGFDYFYGFIGGDTDQWDPTVFENTTPVEPKEKLTGRGQGRTTISTPTSRTRRSTGFQQQHALAPNKPFFAYYAPGATHAPHHVPKEWIAKFKGKFDQGWDKLREETFARQKKLGVIPQDTILTPRPANMPAWDSLDARQKELFSRMAEIYAAFLAYDDYNIGRVIEAVKQEGVADNTLIIFIEGDNGSSAEGTLQGTANEIAVIGNGAKESFDYLYSIKDELGGPLHYNHMPVPWSWAFDTPFQWTKRYASHFGGTRNGMVMSWPGHIKDRRGFARTVSLRDRHHADDSRGRESPGAGHRSTASSNCRSTASRWPTPGTTPRRRRIARRNCSKCSAIAASITMAGWPRPRRSSSPGNRSPRASRPKASTGSFTTSNKDFSQGNDLAKAMPEKLKQMEELWWAEAGRNNALPLNFSPQATVEAVFQKPSLTRGRSHFVFRQGTVRIPEGTAPTVKNTSYTITAKLNVPERGADGVIITQGGRFAARAVAIEYRWANGHFRSHPAAESAVSTPKCNSDA